MDNQTQQETVHPAAPTEPISAQTANPNPYGKKSWSKRILIYIAAAVVLYGIVYFVFLSKKTSNPYSPTTYSIPTTSPASIIPSSNPTSTPQANLNPNTGNLYGDIKTRLQEVIK